MERRTFCRLEHDVHSRAELICVSELIYDIEPSPEVNRQRLEYLPLVLEIEPVVGASRFLVANDRKRHIRRLNSCSVNRKNQVIGFDLCVLQPSGETRHAEHLNH